jgi:hypothetical protein
MDFAKHVCPPAPACPACPDGFCQGVLSGYFGGKGIPLGSAPAAGLVTSRGSFILTIFVENGEDGRLPVLGAFSWAPRRGGGRVGFIPRTAPCGLTGRLIGRRKPSHQQATIQLNQLNAIFIWLETRMDKVIHGCGYTKIFP